MTAEELEKQLRAGQAPVILDVRSGFEFKSGHIKGAVHAPLSNTLKIAQSVSEDREGLLIVVCEHGPRAQLAKVLLKMKGFKNVDLLDGHMNQWRRSGRSVQKGQ